MALTPGGLATPVPLDATHDLAAFDSGAPVLDDWLRCRALANAVAGASRSFVACRGTTVVAYYALAAGALAPAAATGRVRRNMPDPIPMAVLARLAVDRTLHGRGLGRALLADALRRTAHAAEVLAVRGLLVQALDDAARRFYVACGFTPSPGDPLLLMLTLADLRAALPPAD